MVKHGPHHSGVATFVGVGAAGENGDFFAAHFSDNKLARVAGDFRNGKTLEIAVGNADGILHRIGE